MTAPLADAKMARERASVTLALNWSASDIPRGRDQENAARSVTLAAGMTAAIWFQLSGMRFI